MKNLGMLVLGIWLVASGLQSVAGLRFDYDNVVFGVLALVAGVLIIIKK